MGASDKRKERRKAQGLEQARAAWLIASDLAARAFEADVRQVIKTRGTPGRGSDANTTKARKVACYLGMVVANVSRANLAQAADIDPATISVHANWVEDARDDAAFDVKIAELEAAMFGMAVQIVVGKLGEALGGAFEEAAA